MFSSFGAGETCVGAGMLIEPSDFRLAVTGAANTPAQADRKKTANKDLIL
jgi:hypothetical protein